MIDLLLFLSHHQLEYVPIVVITRDKQGVLDHFQRQAPFMGIHKWRSRIYVTNNSSDLISKINTNLLDPYANRRRLEADSNIDYLKLANRRNYYKTYYH